jgi:glutaminyl-peptide cyclotransferase
MLRKKLLRPLKVKARRLQEIGIPRVRPRLIRTFPHDTGAFTQGLFFHGGRLYESTGLHDQSSLREIDPKSGSIRKQVPVEGTFAEGIACLDGRLYQLTWRSDIVLIYDFPSLRLAEKRPLAGTGWGLTSDDSQLIMSNGTSTLEIRDAGLDLLGSQKIVMNGMPLNLLNDLAVHGGSYYLNVYRQPKIYVADRSTGRVRKIIDCTDIASQEYRNIPPRTRNREHAMLNGLAIDETLSIAYLTGKLWSRYYVIGLD